VDRDVVNAVHSTNGIGEFCLLTDIFGKCHNISTARFGLSSARTHFIATTFVFYEANYEVREKALRKIVRIIRIFNKRFRS
jgi:hypothetical protein